VSTLFPPLKAAKQVKEWPSTAMAPAASAQGREPVKRVANQAAVNPLPASIKATGRAGFQPRVLYTLVMPGLLLPTLVISTPWKTRAIQAAEGIEPSK